MRFFRLFLLASSAMALLLLAACNEAGEGKPDTFPLEQIHTASPLADRLAANFNRLQEHIYQPPQVYEDKNWPGDFVGRTILGLTLDARALHSDSQLLHRIVDSLPSVLNAKGYLGPDYGNCINEQQLSGHGWLLRGLSEYEKWTSDKSVEPIIRSIAMNLFVAGKGRYSSYPIDPALRSTTGGQASGTICTEAPDWMLSTDIACIFIGMAGLVDAYEIVPDPGIREVIDELAARFLEIDLTAVKAQTHATLSALRGLLKYAALTDDYSLLPEIEKRWSLYVNEGMTCCLGNLNWFGRPDSWTEPCAIVDSYIVAFELWKITGKTEYRDMAELIAVNAVGHAQRSNGGFGCDSCPSEEDPFLKVSTPEAWWCCTMRGAEGLARIAESSWAVEDGKLYVPFFRNAVLKADGLKVFQETLYPAEGTVRFEIEDNTYGIRSLLIPDLPWADSVLVRLDGETVVPEPENGFLCIRGRFCKGSTIDVSFKLLWRTESWGNCSRIFRGPVQMGLRHSSSTKSIPVPESELCRDSLVPVPVLMTVMSEDCVQVLFK